MAEFVELIEAQLSGATVRYRDLVRFDFRSGEVRLHQGFGTIKCGNGEEWQGIGGLGRIGAVASGPGQAIEELTLTLFGTDGMLASFAADADEAKGRAVTRYLQFYDVRQFDEAGNWVEWHPLDTPFQIFWGKMGAPAAERSVVNAAEDDPSVRTITIRAANAFINRRKPPFGYYSHRDQLARTDGTDFMFVNASRMADATVNWPVF